MLCKIYVRYKKTMYADLRLYNQPFSDGLWKLIDVKDFKGESENQKWAFGPDRKKIYFQRIIDKKEIELILKNNGVSNAKN